jgi:hypothetical protein
VSGPVISRLGVQVGGHRIVFPQHGAIRVVTFNDLEVAAKRLLSGVSVEQHARPDLADRLPEFGQVIRMVVGADKSSARTKDARDLAKPAVHIGEVVQRPVRHDHVEARRRERKLRDVGDPRIETTRTRRCDACLGLIDAHHFRSGHKRGDAAIPTSRVKNPLGTGRRNG